MLRQLWQKKPYIPLPPPPKRKKYFINLKKKKKIKKTLSKN